jgi:tetratricopeptide (TPR) repeat protein
MNNLIDAIKAYAYDPENPELNYSLAVIYDNIGQTASAITYYMRAAERTEIKELAYECLIKQALCFEKQGNRKHTCTILLKHAICLLPKRPEAYFILSRLNERSGEHVESYVNAQTALEVCYFNLPKLRTDVEYPGKWGLLYQKGICAWWWGKGDESREIMKQLKQNHWNDMNESYRKSMIDNMKKVGFKIDGEHDDYIRELKSYRVNQ